MAQLSRTGMLLALIGPAGSGKTHFCSRLLKDYGESLKLSVSMTTRAPRPGETEGKSYFFVSRDDFMRRVDAGEFFEWEQVHGNLYGTLRRTVESSTGSGIDLLLDIDIQGALNFKKLLPLQTVLVFLLPPSLEVLKTRLTNRGTISEQELATRLATARREYQDFLEHATHPGTIDYLIVNDSEVDAYATLKGIVETERRRIHRLSIEGLRALCEK